jgi:hypothetical protein
MNYFIETDLNCRALNAGFFENDDLHIGNKARIMNTFGCVRIGFNYRVVETAI